VKRDRADQEFEQFVATCGDHLLRTGYLVVWDLGLAEDLVQECRIGDQRRVARSRSHIHRRTSVPAVGQRVDGAVQ
jgi:DNA-directed RNA polymerase specialized sigma24 family protein